MGGSNHYYAGLQANSHHTCNAFIIFQHCCFLQRAMDIDLLKSTPEDHQIDMMLMMHMDNKPTYNLIPHNNNGQYIDSSMMAFGSVGCDIPPQYSPTLLSQHNTISFTNNHLLSPNSHLPHGNNNKQTSMAAMREMIFRIAAMQPIYIDPEAVKPPKRRNVKISKDPQSVAARHRRERISERIRILQRLVPGGTKMDTASMLDEAIHYVKFLKSQVQSLERASINNHLPESSVGPSYIPVSNTKTNYNLGAPHHFSNAHNS
ncbi:hypothetical protein RND81_01G100600 [Saponaria officinalis]|uniref:BHLH domain-containing protein n=1 Tax=Saponaria officinalis TaxID=3572 RepID=A0AAW1NEG4_SAPOF